MDIKAPVDPGDTITLTEFDQQEGKSNFAKCPRIAEDGETLSAMAHKTHDGRYVVSCDDIRSGDCDRLSGKCEVDCTRGFCNGKLVKLLVFPSSLIQEES